MSEYRYFHISDKAKIHASGSLVEAILAANAGGYIWVDFYQPAEDELKFLRDPFGLDPQALADWAAPGLPPKMEHFARNTYLRLPGLDLSERLSRDPLVFFIGDKFLLSLSTQDRPTASPLATFTPTETAGSAPAILLHALLKEQVSSITAAIEQLEVQTRQSEHDLLAAPANFDLLSTTKLRQDLRTVRRSLTSEIELLGRLGRKESPFIPEPACGLFKNLEERAAGLLARAEECSEILTDIREIHLSTALRQANETALAARTGLQRLAFAVTVIMPVILLLAINAVAQVPRAPSTVGALIALLIVSLGAALAGTLVYQLLGLSKKKS